MPGRTHGGALLGVQLRPPQAGHKFERAAGAKVQECHCGAENCKGTFLGLGYFRMPIPLGYKVDCCVCLNSSFALKTKCHPVCERCSHRWVFACDVKGIRATCPLCRGVWDELKARVGPVKCYA